MARPGVVLGLIGRDAARLAETAEHCRGAGASVHLGHLDIRHQADLRDWLAAFDAHHPVDSLIANAGISVGTSLAGSLETAEETLDLVQTNLIGALSTVLPLIPPMQARGRGRIVLLSSIAALSPLPDAAAYSASKAALLAYGLAMRERLRADGIKVNVICPGFVTTPMAARYLGWKPFEMTPDDAARRILRGLEHDRAIIAFPWQVVFAARIRQLLPEPLRRLGYRAFRFSVAPPP
ncbi:MAG: SDR family NAD(P)-dependent oxidoreductase [Beijerinckiaceae bacterium]